MSVIGGMGDRMNKDREKAILELLLKKKRVTVKELARVLYASEPSIRRDLLQLEKQNLIRRVHGGAVLEEHSTSLSKIPFVLRELEDHDAKRIMAQKAAALVESGQVIFLDASSSAYAMIPYLAAKTNLTVITSGVKALMLLAEYGIPAFATGGRLLPTCLSLVDDDAIATVKKYNADWAFFSCRGLSPDGWVTDISIEENRVRAAMMGQARRSVLLCASEKFNKTYLHNLCHRDDLTVISDIE